MSTTGTNPYESSSTASLPGRRIPNGKTIVKVQNGFNKHNESAQHQKSSYEQVPLHTACFTYLGFYLLMILGYINQLFFTPKVATEKFRDGYVPLYDAFEKFYLRYVYRRVKDCWNRPICSVPGSEVVLKDRITKDYGWSFEFTGTETKCLNLGSYNYLGFAQNEGPCADDAEECIWTYGLAACSSRRELGTNPLHNELEALTAKFLGVEDAIVFGMGFATNSLNIPTLISPGCLVVSDEKNHASIILGLRLSGATPKVFKHNNMKDLERVLKDSILTGQPGTGKPWKKILIIVEGVFSMEGSIVKLPEIIELKKKYKAYIYLDEAHSIGAMGPSGRGVVDYYGVDPNDIDILMGTFTKSFGSAGGYIAGNKVIAVVRTLTARNIAVVGVGFPATPIMEGRIRFCLSAAHTKEQLDYALSVIDDISDTLGLKYSRKPRNPHPIEY
ncbi:AGAP007941-PA-like protein [Anopheles sinensis]|uniref:serine C-palmitoyltransferase n=1 Tax=Anopheles sinensis TaxID=74873 RepID=A0A084VP09_ANOSI|nr:AGAP007941-PA-like protein [Anopheles sinensis]